VIWLSWRLQRFESMLVAAALALAAVALVPLGLHIASAYNSGVSGCLVHGGPACGETIDSFRHRFEHAGLIIPWLNFLPGLIGVLFAAPLVLDFEHGTFRFAWTQSVPRGRWLAVRLAVMCAAALIATFALTVLMTWFRGPLDRVNGRMEPDVFDFEGIVPYAYTLFALGLALAIGVIMRRVVVAGGIALLVYFTLRVGLQTWGRKDYFAPVRKVWPAGTSGPGNLDHAWNITSGPRDATGHPIPVMHIYNFAVYQPASRFWAMQGIEAAIFGGLALLLFALAAWWVRKRVA